MTDVSGGIRPVEDEDVDRLLAKALVPNSSPNFIANILSEAARQPQVFGSSRRPIRLARPLSVRALRGAIVAGAVAAAAAAAAITAVKGDLRRISELPSMILHPMHYGTRHRHPRLARTSTISTLSSGTAPFVLPLPENKPQSSNVSPAEVSSSSLQADAIVAKAPTLERPQRAHRKILNVPDLPPSVVRVESADWSATTAQVKLAPVDAELRGRVADSRKGVVETRPRLLENASAKDAEPATVRGGEKTSNEVEGQALSAERQAVPRETKLESSATRGAIKGRDPAWRRPGLRLGRFRFR